MRQQSSAQEPSTLRELRGVVERITYQNPDNGYTVARLAEDRLEYGADTRNEAPAPAARGDEERLVTVVGTLADVTPGEVIVARGWWRNDARYGWQFNAVDYRSALPASVQGMKKYLGSGLIKGIGPVNAGRIVEHFGDETFDVIDNAPERLREVAGIGPVRVARIAAGWAEQRHIREVMAALQSFGISTSLAVRIYKKFGDQSARIITQQPYRLAREVWGIGFKTADKIAQAVGIAPDAPERLQAGVLHALGAAVDEGHTLLPEDDLATKAAALLGVEGASPIDDAIAALLATGEIMAAASAEHEGRLLALAPFARAESGLASRLLGLAGLPPLTPTLSQREQNVTARREREPSPATESLPLPQPLGEGAGGRGPSPGWGVESLRPTRVNRIFGSVTWAAAFGWLVEQHQLTLAPEQEDAVRMALTAPVSILTGGPGTGKTHSLRAILALARAKQLTCLLAAPTGRAAKRMEEATGLSAATLHRLLELRPGGKATYGTDHPLQADLVVVDETSMLDALLANQLVKAIAPGSHLLLVGDPDQLPSVGAGDVLADLIRAGRFPVTRLEHIFRQGAGSGIAANARRINAGDMPTFGRGVEDCYFLQADDPAAAAPLVVDLVARRLPTRYGFGKGEVQVLAPMHRGEAGVGALNTLLQERLNPPRDGTPEARGGGRTYRPGDRVLQLKNDYDLKIFNGDLGTVTDLDPTEQELVLALDDGREVRYPYAGLHALTHAYSISVHKSQGAEFPAVVIPLLTSHAAMLGRTLLYTAFTRARRLVVIVGQWRALALAVHDWRRASRHTALAGLLTGSTAFTWPQPTVAADPAIMEEEPNWEGLLETAVDAEATSL